MNLPLSPHPCYPGTVSCWWRALEHLWKRWLCLMVHSTSIWYSVSTMTKQHMVGMPQTHLNTWIWKWYHIWMGTDYILFYFNSGSIHFRWSYQRHRHIINFGVAHSRVLFHDLADQGNDDGLFPSMCVGALVLFSARYNYLISFFKDIRMQYNNIYDWDPFKEIHHFRVQ